MSNFFKAALIVPFIAFAAACDNQASTTDAREGTEEDYTDTDTRDSEGTTDGNQDMTEFAKEAASDGRMEVNMARMALQRAQSDEVRNFAQTIRDDHQQANEQLKSIAEARGWNLPNDMMEKHQEKFRELQQVSDNDFDRRYVSMMVENHERAIQKFENASNQNGRPAAQGDPNMPADRDDNTRTTARGGGTGNQTGNDQAGAEGRSTQPGATDRTGTQTGQEGQGTNTRTGAGTGTDRDNAQTGQGTQNTGGTNTGTDRTQTGQGGTATGGTGTNTAAAGDNQRLQSWIEQTLPVLRRHHQRARELQKQMQ